MEDHFTIPTEVLNDLCSRFIINVPVEERSDLIRIFFQIEIAHWFYLDFYCDENSSLKPCSIRNFAENIFRHCSFLIEHSNKVDSILSQWKTFKHAVPTNGAIILDETTKYVLLVQGFWAKTSWGFPKGKVIEEETEMNCAIREVLEETGYDITSQVKTDQYLQVQINEQIIRLYIVTNVPRETKFEPRTRREIKEVRWFAIEELPVHRKDTKGGKNTTGYTPNAFFMVIPFIKSLKQWIQNTKANTHTPSTLTTSTTYPMLSMTKKSPLNAQQQMVQQSKDESRKQKQMQYFNKMNKEEYDDLVNCKDGSKATRHQKVPPALQQQPMLANNKQQPQFHAFKPVKQNPPTTTRQSVVTTNNTPGLLTLPNGLSMMTAPRSGSKSTSQLSKSADPSANNRQQIPSSINTKIKKQLDFFGPECWINFRFNYDQLLADLPSPVIVPTTTTTALFTT